MRQTLNIFRKDVRHLWPHICAIAALTFAYAIYHPVTNRGLDHQTLAPGAADISSLALVLGWFFLIATVIQQEPLPGDRQFWLTRPYSRMSLVLGKVLFIAAFINVPFLLADCYIVAADGFSVPALLPQLLLKQLFDSMVYLLPAAALAVITTGLTPFFLSGLAIFTGTVLLQLLLQGNNDNWGGLEIVRTNYREVPAAIVAAVVFMRQYARRRTRVMRIFLVAAWLLVDILVDTIPPGAAIAFSHDSAWAAVRLVFEPGRPRYDPGKVFSQVQNGPLLFAIPVRMEGLPAANDLALDTANVGVDWWRSGWKDSTSLHQQPDGSYWVLFYLNADRFAIWKSRPVNLRISTALTVVDNETVAQAKTGAGPFAVPDIGACAFTHLPIRNYSGEPLRPDLRCLAPVYQPARTKVLIDCGGGSPPFTRLIGATTYNPDYFPHQLSPVTETMPVFSSPARSCDFTFERQRPQAHLSRELEISAIRLADYIVASR